MAQKPLKDRLSGAAAWSDPAPRIPVVRPFDDPSGDNETVKRYRRFFETHDLSGRPRRESGTPHG